MINLNRTKASHYLLVQDQLFGLITRHLPPDAWRTSDKTYIDGALNFTLFVALDAEVLMSHGAADKGYHWRLTEDGERVNNLPHRTDLLVPGHLLADRIIEAPALKIGAGHVHSVGWPRLDLLLERQRSLKHRLRRMRRRKKILWAPTHDFGSRGEEQMSLSSYPAFLPYVDILEERYDVTVSAHPRNRDHKAPTDDALIDADVVISDFGTMVYEAWALGKQVIFPHWLIGERIERYLRNPTEGEIFRRRIGLHADNIDEMIEMIETEAQPDPQTSAFVDDYLDPTYRGCSGKRIADLLMELDRAMEHRA